MKKLPKLLLVVLSVVLVLVIGAVVAVGFFADSALKVAIETAGTKALNVDVSVDDVDLAITAGGLGLSGLTIDNPPGYKHDKLLELSDAKIKVETRSLLSDDVRIRDIKLDGMNLVLEQKGLSNNLNEVIKTIKRGEEAKAEPSGKRLHIDNLEISNTKVRLKVLPVPGKVDTITLPLSTIKMTNLGSDDKLDVAALSGKILLAIAGGIAEQGAGILPDEIVGTMASTLGKTIDIGKGILEGGAGAGKEVIKGTGDIGKGITKGLKGILKRKEKE
jgi:hypothetical protein